MRQLLRKCFKTKFHSQERWLCYNFASPSICNAEYIHTHYVSQTYFYQKCYQRRNVRVNESAKCFSHCLYRVNYLKNNRRFSNRDPSDQNSSFYTFLEKLKFLPDYSLIKHGTPAYTYLSSPLTFGNIMNNQKIILFWIDWFGTIGCYSKTTS